MRYQNSTCIIIGLSLDLDSDYLLNPVQISNLMTLLDTSVEETHSLVMSPRF